MLVTRPVEHRKPTITMPRHRDDGGEGQSRHRFRRQSYTPPPRLRSRSRENRLRSENERSRKHEERDRFRSRSRERSHRKRSFSPEDTSPRRHRDKRSRRSHEDESRDKRRRKSRSRTPPPRPFKRIEGGLPDQQAAFNKEVAIAKGEDPSPEKQKPNFAPTGKLAAEANTIKPGAGPAIILKYHEPPEARKPPTSAAWRMYVFKDNEILDTIPLATQSCWLFGREAAVVDYPVEHPSASKQHAVVQFRYIEKRNEWGEKKGKVRPYVIDLESANGTGVNGEKVPEGRYVELRDGDVVTFGLSTREYVVQLPPAG